MTKIIIKGKYYYVKGKIKVLEKKNIVIFVFVKE